MFYDAHCCFDVILPIPILSFQQIQEDGSVIQMTEKEASRIKESLQELRKWLVTDDDRQTKNRQKLMRNLRVCEYM